MLRIASFLSPSMEPVYRFIASHLGQELNMDTRFVVGRSFEQFAAGEVDVGFV